MCCCCPITKRPGRSGAAGRDLGARSLALAAEKISQTALHAGIAFSVMFVATGSLAMGGIAALVEPICNIIVLPLHDRLWTSLERAAVGHAGLRSA